MTIAELIAELQRLPPNAEIFISGPEYDFMTPHIRLINYTRIMSTGSNTSLQSRVGGYLLTHNKPEPKK